MAESPPSTSSRSPWWLRLLQLAITAGIIALVASYASTLLEGKPRPERRGPPPRNATLVEVTPVQPHTQPISITASGTVAPAYELDLFARVQGEVLELGERLQPGALIAEGDTVIKLDARDYRLNLKQAKANLKRAKAELRLEEGQQAIAQAEYDLLKGTLSTKTKPDLELLLRKPQLDMVSATIEAADLARQDASLDIARTHLRAPFDALVLSRSVALGSRVTEATPVARIAATDVWWIEVAIPLDQLHLVDIPNPGENRQGSPVHIYHKAAWGPDTFRTGHVLRLAAGLEDQGRMARLIVAVPNPLDPTRPRMHLGAWVEVHIQGAPLDDVIALPRDLLREGDRAWIMTAEDTLAIRDLEITFRGPELLLVRSGLAPGDRVITNHIGAPVAGMKLRTAGDKKKGPPGDPDAGKQARGGGSP